MRRTGSAVLLVAVCAPAAALEIRGKSFHCSVSGRSQMASTGFRVYVSRQGEVYALMSGCTARTGAASGTVSMLNGGPRRTALSCGSTTEATQTARFDGERLVIDRSVGNATGRARNDRFEIAVSESGARLVSVRAGGGGRGRGRGVGRRRGGGGGGGFEAGSGGTCRVGDRPLF